MATQNPWGDATQDLHARRHGHHRIGVGRLREFLQRNELSSTSLPSSSSSCSQSNYSSITLMQQLETLYQHKSAVLQKMRELEQLEQDLSAAVCLHPHQLQAQLQLMKSLDVEMRRLIEIKPLLLRTLQKNAAYDWIDVELDHQRAFVQLFQTLAKEFPSYQRMVDGWSHRMTQSTATTGRHHDYGAIVSTLKPTFAQYQSTLNEVLRLRDAYAHLE